MPAKELTESKVWRVHRIILQPSEIDPVKIMGNGQLYKWMWAVDEKLE